ncbi:MAG: amidohydrolase [Actinomycetota bacterium]|nr:amidohydrolase [Actinomycetota bacterium]
MAGQYSFALLNATAWVGPGRWLEGTTVLVSDGVIAAIGHDLDYAEAETVIDASGASLLPAFGEGHAHPMHAGVREQFAPIAGAKSLEELLSNLRTWADEHPDEEWVQGWGYDPTLVANGCFDARWIDGVIADRPVLLRATDYHTIWCNSLAMQLAGITTGIPQPGDGEIVLREDGSPMGTLREWGAAELVFKVTPPISLERKIEALRWSAEEFLRGGITWVQDAWVEPEDLAPYFALAERGLPIRFNLGLRVDPKSYRDQVKEYCEIRDRVNNLGNPRLSANTVKIFADGVIESGTAAMLEPYHDCPTSHGIPNFTAEELIDAVVSFDREHFQVHIHAIGDRAIRNSLDAFEAAIARNEPWDRRPTIAHSQLIDPADLTRFTMLGVIANFEPLWAQLDPLQTRLTIPRIGQERGNRQYPIATLLGLGATVSFGSDWPVSDYRPLAGIAVAITRQNAQREPENGWQPHERISIDQAIEAYSLGTAYQAFADQDRGRLEVGKMADMVLVEGDIRTMDPHALADARVLRTFIEGVEAYRAPVL